MSRLLRIFVNESDQWKGQPLYQAIVELLRRAPLAGCTVVRGVEGFGAGRQVHDARFEGLYLDLPVIIEAVDAAEKIDAVLPQLDPMMTAGLITLEDVYVTGSGPNL